MAVNVVSFSFSWCSTGIPEAHSAGWWFSLLHLINNFSGPPLNRGPWAPSAWCCFPYYISSITPTPALTAILLTELYYSSTPTQLLTRSLESHDWSSSSGNNCHAVHRSLSSGASVYECTTGIFFTSSHFISQFSPTRFPLISATRMCHFFPVHHLGMAFLAGSEAKIQYQYESFGECTKRTDYNCCQSITWSIVISVLQQVLGTYLSFYFLFYTVISLIRQILSFLFPITRSGRLVEIIWSICISKSHFPVGWSSKIHRLPLCRGIYHLNDSPGYETKESYAEVPVMLDLLGMRSIPLLPLLPGPHWPGIVAPDWVLSMG